MWIERAVGRFVLSDDGRVYVVDDRIVGRRDGLVARCLGCGGGRKGGDRLTRGLDVLGGTDLVGECGLGSTARACHVDLVRCVATLRQQELRQRGRERGAGVVPVLLGRVETRRG